MSPSAPDFRLDGRLALITGSSGGIGLALARALAQAGARVVLNGRRGDKLAAAAELLRSEGLAVHEQAFDVCDPAAVQAGVEAIEAALGPIDILVNNAGTTQRAPFHEFPIEAWQHILRTNVDSMIIVSQAVSRRMVARGRGSIVNIASVQSEVGRPGIAPYAASKGAVKMLTKGMAIDLGPHGLRVNGTDRRTGGRHRLQPVADQSHAQPPLGGCGGSGRRGRLPGQRCGTIREWPYPVRGRWRDRQPVTAAATGPAPAGRWPGRAGMPTTGRRAEGTTVPTS
jgi:gluconate 5-dehydrogenase